MAAQSSGVGGDAPRGRGAARVALVALGTWMGLCGGTLYAFSAWEVELMDQCRLTARELGTIYTCGMLGVGLGIIPGLLFDRRGPVATCLYALVFTLAGNAGLSLALSGGGRSGHCAGAPTLGVLYLLLQNGSVSMYQSGLLSNQTAAQAQWHGTIVGIVAAGYGLSAAAFSSAYATVFSSDLQAYLRGTSAIFAITAVVAACALPRLMAGAGVGSQRTASYGKLNLVDASPPPTPGSAPSAATIGAPIEEEPSAPGTVDSRAQAEPMADPGTPSKPTAPQSESTLGQALRSCDLWHSIGTFMLLQAVGSGMFIANLSLMSDSLGIAKEQRLLNVRVVSYLNCFGRILAGLLLDSAEARCGVPRPVHFVWTSGVLTCAGLLLRTASDEAMPEVLLPALMGVGLAYGANWAVMPSCLVARFGHANKGVLFNLHASCLSVSVAATSAVVGDLYDAAAAAQQQSQQDAGEQRHGVFCEGASCWRASFGIGFAMSGAGLASAVAMAVRARSREAFE